MTFSSAAYWQERYTAGGSSGAGSQGASARLKAAFLNRFVRENKVETVVEFGCGDGEQLSLAEYPFYTGYDVSGVALQRCWDRYGDDYTKEFFLLPRHHKQRKHLSLSLDVIYHLVEDSVYERHLHDVFAASARWAILYTSDTDRGASNEFVADHVHHRPVAADVERNFPAWQLEHEVEGMDGCWFYVYGRSTG